MQQLSGPDAAFVYAETADAAHVTFGAVTVEDVIAHVGSRFGADR
jgi:hypothetical protein